MDEEERKKLKYRYQYLNLSYKIMQFRMNGQNPPMDLIDHAIEKFPMRNCAACKFNCTQLHISFLKPKYLRTKKVAITPTYYYPAVSADCWNIVFISQV
jgi:hypothetical protein